MIDMELNITQIVEDKLQEMEKHKTIEKVIGETIENSIVKAVESALGGYKLRSKIEEKFELEVSGIVNEVGISGYNQYIADTFRRLTEVQMKEEIREKIAGSFENIFVKKREKIQLSEIVDEYMIYLRDQVEDYEGKTFEVKVERVEDTVFERYKVHMEPSGELKEEFEYVNPSVAVFRIMNNKITNVRFDEDRLDRLEGLRYMYDFECLLASLFFNNTYVEVDLDEGTNEFEL